LNIVILGPQGSGKGTQADLLSRHFKIPHIDGGQLLRNEIAQKTEVGKKIAGPIKRGELIPSEIMDDIIRSRIAQPDCAKGFVFDGYPRQLEEAEFLDSITDIDAVVILDIPDELAVKRLAARRICIGCTVPLYGLPKDIKKPCESCGGKLEQRADDQPAAVKRRLELYHEQTEPLIEYYRPREIVHVVDGSKEIQPVFKSILKELE
jgi:adenylate kinase